MEKITLFTARNKTKTVSLGGLKIGSGYPLRIKGMLKGSYLDIEKVIAEAKKLEEEGAEAIRMAVKEKTDSQLVSVLKKNISLPFVADIHFHAELAFLAIERGFAGIRLNPLNIYKKEEVRAIVKEAKKAKIPIRIGINSGGFKKKFSSPMALAQAMLNSVTNYISIFEKENFFDIMVSLKGSDIQSTVIANRMFAKKFDYPLHLGVTATGPFMEGVVKSSVALGMLLASGIGDCIRVSLTGPSFWEIRVAKYILQALKIRTFGPEIISCPTCSRCEVDLIKIAHRFKKELDSTFLPKPLKIAIMGCVVNGPGEAYQADIGIACGKGRAAIFRKDKILGWSTEDTVVGDLLNEVKRMVK